MGASVIIADDEPLARERLRRLLRVETDYQLVGEATDGPGAVRLLREQRPQIAILDIRLPGLDAFDVLKSISGEPPPAVIFVTGFSDRALDAFHAGAVDYLLKPFDSVRLRSALDRARQRRPGAVQTAELEPPAPSVSAGRIALRSGGRWIILDYDDLEFITAANTRCDATLRNGSQLKIQESLGELMERLPPDRFVRVSRFTAVHLDAVRSVSPKSHGDQSLQLRSGFRITLSRTHRVAVLERLKQR